MRRIAEDEREPKHGQAVPQQPSLWEHYDRPAGEVFAIQSDVADRIANSLGGSAGHVTGSVLVAARRKRPGDLGAYELYLLGRDKMINGLTLENQLEAKG